MHTLAGSMESTSSLSVSQTFVGLAWRPRSRLIVFPRATVSMCRFKSGRLTLKYIVSSLLLSCMERQSILYVVGWLTVVGDVHAMFVVEICYLTLGIM